MVNLLKQIKNLRIKLGLKQHDMLSRIGVSRQQYQRLETKGNPRLTTLELVAKGLNAELMLVPINKIPAVLAALDDEEGVNIYTKGPETSSPFDPNDPWRDLLEDDE